MRRFSLVTFLLLVLCAGSLNAQGWEAVFRAGGTQRDMGRQIWVDNARKKYVTGTYEGKMALGEDTLRSKFGKSAFLACFDSFNQFQWVQQAHMKEGEDCLGLVGDGKGNLYWAGSFWESVVLGEEELEADNSVEIFLAKLNTKGKLQWVKSIAQTNYLKPWFGGEPDLRISMAIHPDGGLYLGSTFRDTIRIANTTLAAKGGTDGFLIRLNPKGMPVWIAPSIGGEEDDWLSSFAVDSAGTLALAGRFTKDFQLGTFRLRTDSPYSYFLAKYSDQGQLLWADEIGNATKTDHACVASGRGGEVLLSGGFESNYFLHKYTHRGHRVWKIRGGDAFSVSALVVGEKGNIYVSGAFSNYLDLGEADDRIKSNGGKDIFVAEFQPDGQLSWLSTGGGEFFDAPSGLFLDPDHAVWVIGTIRKEVQFGVYRLSEIGSVDMFWGQIK